MINKIDKLDMTKIIEKRPNWIIRWGVTLFGGILLFGCVCYYLLTGNVFNLP